MLTSFSQNSSLFLVATFQHVLNDCGGLRSCLFPRVMPFRPSEATSCGSDRGAAPLALPVIPQTSSFCSIAFYGHAVVVCGQRAAALAAREAAPPSAEGLHELIRNVWIKAMRCANQDVRIKMFWEQACPVFNDLELENMQKLL